MHYRILPLRPGYLERVRSTGLDDLDQPVRRSFSAQGGEPCRDALRRARPGEEIILASYSPFTARGPYREFGPVFVLAQAAEEPVRDRLPFAPEDPLSYFVRRLTLRAYSSAEDILDARIVEGPEAEGAVQEFLGRPEVAWVDARFPAYGCFAARFVRA